MKKRCVPCLVLLVAVCALASAKTLSYLETTNKKRVMRATFSIDVAASGYRVTLKEDENGAEVHQAYETDTGLATLSWAYRNAGKNTAFTAIRRGETIVLSGTHEGKPIQKKFTVGSAPWNQLFTLGLRQFVLSGENERRFWAIGTSGPGEMRIAQFVAAREGSEAIVFGGKEIGAVKVRITFPDLKSLFWHADCWFRESDGMYLRYEGWNGPGEPLTIAELIGEG